MHDTESESDAIRRVIEIYFRGHALNDADSMRAAFLPTAHVEGNREGRFTSWTLDDYCALFKNQPAADEPTRTRRIDWIDSTEDAAAAQATLVHGPITFTDYFMLLKVDGEWRIANKVYASAATP